MELSVRDWMVIVGALLILAVGLDAWRRVRSERYSRVRMKLAEPQESEPDRDADFAWLRELPNGGARVVSRDDLVRPREQAADSAVNERREDGPVAASTPPVEDEELVSGVSSDPGEDDPENIDWLDDLDSADAAGAPAAEPGRLPRYEDPQVFMLNVVARDPAGFRGEDILHILLACDLRFGDMSFFHRHEFEAGRGPIQFSVANMMQPGVFDIDNMSDFTTPGLVFFLTLPGPEDMMQAFDFMLETARTVARNLGGDVLDESRSVLTRQSLEHCRQQIRDLERRLLARAR